MATASAPKESGVTLGTRSQISEIDPARAHRARVSGMVDNESTAMTGLQGRSAEWLAETAARLRLPPDLPERLLETARESVSLEASAVFLLGAVASAIGGRILVAAVGGIFVYCLGLQLRLIAGAPEWVFAVLVAFLALGLVHAVLSLLPGPDGAAQALILLLAGLATLLIVKPAALLRIPGLSHLEKGWRK